MSNASSMYALTIDQIVNAIATVGHLRTILVEGDMGSGKSSILKELGKKFPNHVLAYFDCTTKDVGDISLPNLAIVEENGYVRYVPNEELGLHLGKPIILMIDEFGKALPPVKNALLRLKLERMFGTTPLHPESRVFSTTNLGAEGVGDMLLPHHRNRLSVVRMRKPNAVQFIEWGINNGIDQIVLGWVKDNPHVMQSFTDIAEPYKDRTRTEPTNPYVYHPQISMTAFVTPRSLHAASDILKQRHLLDPQTTTALLIGAIGERAAMDMSAFIAMADKLPTLEEIKTSPATAKIPDSAAAVCMIVFKVLSIIDRTWVDAWMEYLLRLDKEAQGAFANGVRAEKYDEKKRVMVMTNKKYQAWALTNNYLFQTDK